ncbi:hypothetical protein AAFF_G00073870 [Aldrovandia affinis]|uniref:Tetratricopeptide SHNi-TPR domain-containing protein n=1 Tax=Aldrovandia affinis TaxID=143900 RepID=A0AAD7RY85_9TELE|nr:hypothetical protein AAFF_G00073870 [Aldrovandia affinis]
MPEDTPAPSSAGSMEEKPCSSSAADGSDIMEEAKKLIGTGNRHLVMGDVVSAVNVFQEACGMLAEKYGDTADQCGEAFFLCGKSLLELARMENTVLGNALEGVPEESSEEGEKMDNSKIESADNLDEKTRDELRVQVYDAMAEKEKTEEKMETNEEQDVNVAQSSAKEENGEIIASPVNGMDKDEGAVPKKDEGAVPAAPSPKKDEGAVPAAPSPKKEEGAVPPAPSPKKDEGAVPPAPSPKKDEGAVPPAPSPKKDEGAVPAALSPKKDEGGVPAELSTKKDEGAVPAAPSPKKNEGDVPVAPSTKKDEGAVPKKNEGDVPAAPSPKKNKDDDPAAQSPKKDDVKGVEVQKEEVIAAEGEDLHEDQDEKMDEGGDDDDNDYDNDDEGEGTAEDKESEEEEVGNLQLAWEMLEVAKVIYKRREGKEDQLMAAQAYLKLGEVGAESGNYVQALEDFQECLNLQLKHLPPHSRLLAETHYQLGVTFGYTSQYAQAIQHFSSSIQVIESRLAMLQEAIDKAGDTDGATEEKRETEELKQLLPDIREKVEDARESQKTAGVASVAIQQTLSGASTSAFSGENGGTSSSTVSQISVTPTDGATSKSALDISHLVRKKRKPEEGSPVKDSDAKKAKQEATVNSNGDSASNGNGVQEKMEQDEPVKPSAAVETS